MERFGKISSIDLDKPETWQEQVFLTFDIDWASDEVLEATIDLVEEAEVAATWYVTHHTMLLARLRANPKFEVGMHPNFNFLLMGREDNGRDAGEVVERLRHLVPEATSVRSHSMTQSTPILDIFWAAGLTHECNHFVPVEAGITLKPWRNWTGLVKVPYFWEDDIDFFAAERSSPKELMSKAGLRVFDFHPIHVFLNCESATRYELARPHFQHFASLQQCVNHRTGGVRDQLNELLGVA